MKLFNEIEGKFSTKFQDDIILLLIKCGNKRKGESPQNLLAEVIKKFNLSENSSYRDIKKKLWEFLKIKGEPIFKPL